MHLIDSHAHLDMIAADLLPAVLARALEAEVRTILAVGIGEGPDTMHRALEIAETPTAAGTNTPEIYASAGIHPQNAGLADARALAELAGLTDRPRCIAVGEIGLDYYHADNPDVRTQQEAFAAQMQVAVAARKPILIHCRTSELARPDAKARYGEADAWMDLLLLLGEHWQPHGIPGIMHCFSGTVEHARRSLDLGFYLSFAGNVTYPTASALREAAAFAPPDRILVETDAPFLAPVPLRGQTNEPAYVAHTAAALAKVRGKALEDLCAETTANFQTLFPEAGGKG